MQLKYFSLQVIIFSDVFRFNLLLKFIHFSYFCKQFFFFNFSEA